MEKIVHFLSSNFLLSLSLIIEGEVYAINCFYIFDQTEFSLIFTTSKNTFHYPYFLNSPNVAGTIACCKKDISTLQGVQFKGKIEKANFSQKREYLQNYPIALALKPTFWKVKLKWVKMTDNSLGFGKKLIWTRPNGL
ncbi:MAG: hypothetical protein GXO61_05175 [Epsilonproteobacteria bacterium]|nr:hypothetical protein [Campylobacterota bacterium]